ncbi:hypothetical protein D3C87_1389010 [compost metagenome]
MLQDHRIEVVHQCPEASLQMFAVVLQLAHRALDGLGLVGNQAQQTSLGTNAGQVLAEIVVQGLGQLCPFLLLHGQQRLGQPGVVGTGLFQRGRHAVEMHRQLPRLRQSLRGQAHLELASAHLLQGPQ